VYFNQDPVLSAGGGGVPAEFAAFLGGGGGPSQNITPMAAKQRMSAWVTDSANAKPAGPDNTAASDAAALMAMARQFGLANDEGRPRVVMTFPQKPEDMLLSGVLSGGQGLAGKAKVIDAPVGKGHVVMFAIRPFWRWQTQGTYTLGFNAIMNWNDLDAGKTAPGARGTAAQPQP